MSDEKTEDSAESPVQENTGSDSGHDQSTEKPTQSGPAFTEAPDPLAGVKKSTASIMDSMEGKTVSMKTYVGTIIGVVVLMLLARCGG